MESIDGKAKKILVDDIDTDQIFHASLLTVHEAVEIKPHIFGNLLNYKTFGTENHQNEILIVGKNFGKGSTRQQAVTGFLAHGINVIMGVSFGPIYYSNAINAGLLLLECPSLNEFDVDDGDILEVNLIDWLVINKTKKSKISILKVPKPVFDIINAGGLLELGKNWEENKK